MISLNAKHMGVDVISVLPIQDLCLLKEEIDFLLREAKEQSEILEAALAIRFGKKTTELLQQDGRDSGTIHFEEDSYTITANIPKKVTWDQDKLATLIPVTLEAEKFVETTYKINEQKYLTYCSPAIRMILDEAREVSTGKPKFILKLK